MDITFDASEFKALAADLRKASETLPQRIRPAVQKGALNVKNGQNADLDKSPSFRRIRSSYDSREGRDFAEAEVGPKTSGEVVGDLYHIAVFGGVNSGGGTVRDPQAVLDEEAPRFEKALLDLVKDLL
jgi:hypothetical protein